jgi:hypothetical protein
MSHGNTDEKTYKRKGHRDMNTQNAINTMDIYPVRFTGRERSPLPPHRPDSIGVSKNNTPATRKKILQNKAIPKTPLNALITKAKDTKSP